VGAGREETEKSRLGLAPPALPLEELRVPVEDLSQLAWRLHPMLFHDLEQAQDVPHARKGDALFSREVLDHLDLADVALRVAASVGARAMRLDEPRVLVQHQGAGVRFQDLSRDADRVQRLVEIAE
jgi:hypothetical protein